ncbi:MAG: carbohydrate porin [Candidatus Omnitrophica bacterium]|nr:carbohydrate porin [Candidatus Omnitrophota bacterium]
MKLFYGFFCLILWISIFAGPGWANELAAQSLDQIVQRFDRLEKMVLDQKAVIEDQNQMIANQEARLAELQADIEEIRGRKIDIKIDDDQMKQLAAQVYEHPLVERENYEWLGGLKFGAGATFVGQHAYNIHGAKRGEDETDASYSIDLEVEKEFDDWGYAFLHLETGDGAGVDRNLADVFASINRDADDSGNLITLTEVYYEHYLLDHQLTLTGGYLDSTIIMDQNEIAHDEASQFLSLMFRNSVVTELPGNHLGFRGIYAPEWAPWIEVTSGMIDGDLDGNDFFDTAFSFAQINLKPDFWGEDLPGNYRFYFWHNDTNHTNLMETDRVWDENHGWGVSADQCITDTVTLFSRFGWQDETVSNAEIAWSFGIQLDGQLWNRTDDRIGIAFGQVFPGGDYHLATTKIGQETRLADTEHHLELYYNYALNDHLIIGPDLQVIWNPAGNDPEFASSNVVIAGLRGQVDF